MTLQLLRSMPWALLAMVVAARVIPYLSALATDHAGWWTGMITDILAFGGSLLAEYAQQPSHFDWSAAVLTGLGAWAVAALEHSKKLKGTDLESSLHARGAHIGKRPTAPSGDAGVADLLVVLVVVLLLIAVFGGFFLTKWLFVLLVFVVVIGIAARSRL